MREQPYCVAIGKDLYEVHGESPYQAAAAAARIHRHAEGQWLDDPRCHNASFEYAFVFTGKAPEAIHNPCGHYAV